MPSISSLWEFIYPTGADALGGIQVLYVLVPWIGVMAAGYGFDLIAAMDEAARHRWCLRIGLGAAALFLAFAIPVAIIQPASPDGPPFLFRILGQNKYPASQLFLLMTLGPRLRSCRLRSRSRLARARVRTFGRVPMFIPAAHSGDPPATLAMAWLRDGIHHEWYVRPFRTGAAIGPMESWRVYLVFLVVVVALYFPARSAAENPDAAIAVAELHLIAR